MTFTEFRQRMDAFWASANREADELKDPVHALERLIGFYRRLDAGERGSPTAC